VAPQPRQSPRARPWSAIRSVSPAAPRRPRYQPPDQALRDPAHPTRTLPISDCGDRLHPSDLGYTRMGDAVDLALFE